MAWAVAGARPRQNPLQHEKWDADQKSWGGEIFHEKYFITLYGQPRAKFLRRTGISKEMVSRSQFFMI